MLSVEPCRGGFFVGIFARLFRCDVLSVVAVHVGYVGAKRCALVLWRVFYGVGPVFCRTVLVRILSYYVFCDIGVAMAFVSRCAEGM